MILEITTNHWHTRFTSIWLIEQEAREIPNDDNGEYIQTWKLYVKWNINWRLFEFPIVVKLLDRSFRWSNYPSMFSITFHISVRLRLSSNNQLLLYFDIQEKRMSYVTSTRWFFNWQIYQYQNHVRSAVSSYCLRFTQLDKLVSRSISF